eukprot:812287-Amphidinium_carterae.1
MNGVPCEQRAILVSSLRIHKNTLERLNLKVSIRMPTEVLLAPNGASFQKPGINHLIDGTVLPLGWQVFSC